MLLPKMRDLTQGERLFSVKIEPSLNNLNKIASEALRTLQAIKQWKSVR